MHYDKNSNIMIEYCRVRNQLSWECKILVLTESYAAYVLEKKDYARNLNEWLPIDMDFIVVVAAHLEQ